MQLVSLSAFLLLALVASVQCEIELDEGVLVLTEDNFKDAIKDNILILVEFYAPWCGHCKKLAPEYAAAAKLLADSDSPVKLAKVDATVHKSLGGEYGVKGYPTLKFFKNGEPMEYSGGRTTDTIVAWVTKKSGPPAITLGTVEAAEKLVEDNKVTVLGFFKDVESDAAKQFVKAADSIDDQVFGITSESDIMSKYEAEDGSIVLLKKFDEGRNVFEGEITSEAIIGFVNTNALPVVVDFNQKTAQKIFGSGAKAHFMIFSSAKDEKHQEQIDMVTKIAKKHKGELMFVSVTTDEEEHKRVLDFFGISETPTFRICKVSEDFIKFKPESSDFTEENINEFIEAHLAGKLTVDLKSQEIPEDWDAAPVKVLVGKNFEEVALDSTKDVFVEFYAPWCGHCKKLAPIWDELAEKFKDDDDIVIAKMDSTANEVKDVKVRGFPTLKLFKKDGSIVDFNGARDLESMAKFLKPDQEEKEEAKEGKDEL